MILRQGKRERVTGKRERVKGKRERKREKELGKREKRKEKGERGRKRRKKKKEKRRRKLKQKEMKKERRAWRPGARTRHAGGHGSDKSTRCTSLAVLLQPPSSRRTCPWHTGEARLVTCPQSTPSSAEHHGSRGQSACSAEQVHQQQHAEACCSRAEHGLPATRPPLPNASAVVYRSCGHVYIFILNNAG